MKYKTLLPALLLVTVFLFAPLYGAAPPGALYVLSPRGEDAFIFEISDAVKTHALAALLLDADSGRVLYAKNAQIILPMASTTKIMTAVIILETLDLESEVKVTKESVGVEGSSIYLMEGEVLTVRELLYGMLLPSGNDAANALAVACAGSVANFAGMMNRKAEELGLSRTFFANPSGLPAKGHSTTAYDLACLAAYAIKNETFVKITSTVKTTITKGSRYLVNRNALLRSYAGMIGVKTGYTSAAGRCLVTAAKRDGVTLVAVTLNGGNTWNDHKNMLDYGFAFLESTPVLYPGQVQTEIAVAGGKVKSVAAQNMAAAVASLPKDTEFYVAVSSKKIIYAPVAAGDVVGEVNVYAAGTVIASVPLVATESVDFKKLNFFERFLH